MNARWLLPAALVTSSCFQDYSTGPPVAVRAIEHVSPAAILVMAGDEAPNPVVRLVESESRRPVPNETVEFLLRPSSGSISNVVTRSDANGIASAGKWTLPVQAGEAILDVRASGLRISFAATIKPGAPVALKAVDSTIAWIAGEAAPAPVFSVVDRFGNAIDGLPVTFAIAGGGGQLGRVEAVTARGGKASPGTWRLGESAGHNTMTATFSDAPPVTARTIGLDRASVVWYDLESVAALAIPTGGVERATLGFTRFDPCLCTGETGYFILDIMQAGFAGGPNAMRVGLSGRYDVQSKQILLIGERGETRGSPEGESNIYMVRDQTRPLEGTLIRLDVAQWYPAADIWFTTRWTFREAGR